MKKNTPSFTHAPYPLKVKALITDMFMIYAPILYITAYVIMDGKESFQASQLAPLVAVTLYGVIYALFICKLAQTPGKKAYSLKVLDVHSGKKISFIRAFFRFVIFLFSATIVIGIFFPLYRKDKKSLHDIVCGTIEVVEKDK